MDFEQWENYLAKPVEVLTIGQAAEEGIRGSKNISITGVTSQGIFLLVDERHVFFVSFGSYRSPLTLTLGQRVDEFSKLTVGERVEKFDGSLLFPKIRLRLTWQKNNLWSSPPAITPPVEAEARLITMQKLAGGILQNKPGEQGFTPLLAAFTDHESPNPLDVELQPVYARFPILLTGLRANQPDQILAALEPLFGMGRGLTPSGDDFAAGILLALNRYPELVDHHAYPSLRLNEMVIEAARKRTTRLSINIIEQASYAAADERILAGIDAIAASSQSLERIIQDICHLGHSSGADMTVGFILTLWSGHSSTLML